MRILVAEDDAQTADHIGDLLLSGGHDVTTVLSGPEALTLITEQQFDVVILDRMLSGRSGMDVLRGERDGLSSPVLMLTALGSISDGSKVSRAGRTIAS